MREVNYKVLSFSDDEKLSFDHGYFADIDAAKEFEAILKSGGCKTKIQTWLDGQLFAEHAVNILLD